MDENSVVQHKPNFESCQWFAGKTVGILRHDANMTRDDLAMELGITQTALIAIEEKGQPISFAEFCRICNILGISICSGIETLCDVVEKSQH
jgi:transcriptional regulator with XRE-family HTH domain